VASTEKWQSRKWGKGRRMNRRKANQCKHEKRNFHNEEANYWFLRVCQREQQSKREKDKINNNKRGPWILSRAWALLLNRRKRIQARRHRGTTGEIREVAHSMYIRQAESDLRELQVTRRRRKEHNIKGWAFVAKRAKVFRKPQSKV
jgi:hypothetical protein